MSGDLARLYRPRTFGDVAGQGKAVAMAYRMCWRGTVPGAMLFYGKYGSGKTTLARIVAKALNCEAGPGPAASWPCGSCASCTAVDSETHPDVEEVDAASNGGVDQVKAICQRAWYGPAGNGRRVILLDEAHGLTGPAFEHLLKILEEPPAGVLFILLTTQYDAVPKPARSRCSPFQFDPLPASVIAARLAHVCAAEGLSAEPALLAAIAEASGGALRDAVVALDQMACADIMSLELWQKLTGQADFAPALLAAAANGDHAAMYAAMDEALASRGDPGHVAREVVRCLTDLMVLSCGAPVAARGEALAARQALLDQVGRERASAAMAVLWDLQTKVRAEDRESALELALAMVSRRLHLAPAPIAPAGGGPASLAEMKAILEGA